MEFIGYKCDTCKKTKGETNRWFLVVVVGNRFIVDSFEALADFKATYEGAGAVIRHLCGHECVHAKLNEFMGER